MFGLLFCGSWANFSHNSNRNQLCDDIEQGDSAEKCGTFARDVAASLLLRHRAPGRCGMKMPFFRGRMGKLTLLLLALLVWLQYSLWFGKTDCTTIAG